VGAGDWSERGNRRGSGAGIGGRRTNLVLTCAAQRAIGKIGTGVGGSAQNSHRGISQRTSRQQDAPQQIFTFTLAKQIEIELLVNNAGFGAYGEFATSDTQRLLDMVQVNCGAVVHLTRLYLPQMLKRSRGDVLILASTASFQAVPFISTYAATKAFVYCCRRNSPKRFGPTASAFARCAQARRTRSFTR